MTDLRDFIAARLEEDRALAQAAIDDIYGEDDCFFDTSNAHICDHYLHHQPSRVLREVAAKRRVMERHCLYDGIGSKYTDYCEGCPSGDDSGYPEVELNDCPELRDLAAPYSDHPDFDPNWSTT